MSRPMTRRTVLASAAGAAALFTMPKSALAAASHDVQMLIKHPDDPKLRNVYLPRILVVEAGDTVNFLSTEKTHNSASVRGMIPEGAESWNGRVNADVSVTFEMPGFYGYQCTPHASLGMVGLVIVRGEGMMDNMEDAMGVRQRGKAKQAWEEIWEEVAGMELTA